MKTILTLMLLPLCAQAQTFINLGTTDKGVLVGTGFKDRRGAVVSISYSSSLSSTEVPNTLMMNQVDYIKENHSDLTTQQLATAVGCSQSTVWAWLKKYRLKATKSFFQHKEVVIPKWEPY